MDDFDFADFELHPGPKDPSVLHLQAEHRSTNIWIVGGGDNQRSRVRNKYTPVDRMMVSYLRDMHFDGVARLSGIHIDWSLVTDLVERWSGDTHVPFANRRVHNYTARREYSAWFTCPWTCNYWVYRV